MSTTIIFRTSQNNISLYFRNIVLIGGLISLWSVALLVFKVAYLNDCYQTLKLVNASEDKKRWQVVPVLKWLEKFDIMMMMNCFCGMVSLISNRDHCQRSSSSRMPDTPHAGFEAAQNLSSGSVEWICAVVMTTTPRCHSKPSILVSSVLVRCKKEVYSANGTENNLHLFVKSWMQLKLNKSIVYWSFERSELYLST